jgi:3-oxoacyl-[acyl-carrier protein] reductase
MRTIIVTGGSRGLGLAIARTLVTAGYRVVTIARRETGPLASTIREAEADMLHFHPFDLADIAGIPSLVKELRLAFGPIHGLVNCAALGTSGTLALMPDTAIERLVNLNVTSPLVLTKYVVRSMMSEGHGRIVNIASIAGFSGLKGLSAYAATKASLIGFTRSLAREVGSLDITVNAVAPGFVETDMTSALRGEQREQIIRRSALHRLAGADDVANAVAFLISDKARNITGTVLTVDAGSSA